MCKDFQFTNCQSKIKSTGWLKGLLLKIIKIKRYEEIDMRFRNTVATWKRTDHQLYYLETLMLRRQWHN